MTTEERIEKLEKGLVSARRFNRWLLAAVGLALGVWILAGTFGPTTAAAPVGGGALKEVRANRFVVEDENGNLRVALGLVKGGAGLYLYDESGKGRVTVDATKDGPRLALYDEMGKTSALLSINKDGPALGLNDEKGNTRAVLSTKKGEPMLCLADEKGTPRALLDLNKDGPALCLNDEKGNARAMLDLAKDGPEVNLYDEKGTVMWQASNRTAPASVGDQKQGPPASVSMTPEQQSALLQQAGQLQAVRAKVERDEPLTLEEKNLLLNATKGSIVGGTYVGFPLTVKERVALGMYVHPEVLRRAQAETTSSGAVPGAVAQEVRAKQFVVVDENGRARVVLAASKDGPTLGLTDERGKVRAWLDVTKDGPGLLLFDEKGKPIWRAP